MTGLANIPILVMWMALGISSLFVNSGVATNSQPHVVFIVADDLGFHDVGWHNSEVLTPNLDKLAHAGLILNRSYVLPTCTPSRSAFLTGRYPFKLGTQHGPFGDMQPAGLPAEFSLLPHYLKRVGYKTHLVGKWHLGFCKEAFLPTKRGFDTHYGYLAGYETYTTHYSALLTNSSIGGYDFRDNLRPIKYDKYSTYAYADRVSSLIQQHNSTSPLFLMYTFQAVHMPLEVPRRFYDKYPHVKDNRRRIYLGMMSALDEAVGRLVADLKRARMFDNTLIIFSSDNGGKKPYSGASNYPLTGYKDTLWEGGVRVVGFIYSKDLEKKDGRRVENGYVHATDWMPTILDHAGYNISSLSIDGISHAKTLLKRQPSRRKGFIVNIDEIAKKHAIVLGPWKLVIGNPSYCRSYNNVCAKQNKSSFKKPYLFNIHKDPLERHNLVRRYPSIKKLLHGLLEKQMPNVYPSVPTKDCPAGNPKNFGGFWSPGWCTHGCSNS